MIGCPSYVHSRTASPYSSRQSSQPSDPPKLHLPTAGAATPQSPLGTLEGAGLALDHGIRHVAGPGTEDLRRHPVHDAARGRRAGNGARDSGTDGQLRAGRFGPEMLCAGGIDGEPRPVIQVRTIAVLHVDTDPRQEGPLLLIGELVRGGASALATGLVGAFSAWSVASGAADAEGGAADEPPPASLSQPPTTTAPPASATAAATVPAIARARLGRRVPEPSGSRAPGHARGRLDREERDALTDALQPPAAPEGEPQVRHPPRLHPGPSR